MRAQRPGRRPRPASPPARAASRQQNEQPDAHKPLHPRAQCTSLRRARGAYARDVAIRVVLAEDSLLVREGVRRLLDLQPGVEVVASVRAISTRCSRRSSRARRMSSSPTSACRPTITDEGIQAALRLRETHPELGVVVLSQYAEPAYALALLEGGSERRAYLLKDRVADVEPAGRRHPRGRRAAAR